MGAGMKEKPILFSTPMVKAILEGKKTQTRRVITPQPKFILKEHNGGWNEYSEYPIADPVCNSPWGYGRICKYKVGDILWVREAFRKGNILSFYPLKYYYKADNPERKDAIWKPSIHMPREAARLFLEVTSVRVERLQDITDKEAIAEGMITNEQYAELSGEAVPEAYCPTCNGTGLHLAVGENLGVMEVDCCKCDTAKKRFSLLWDSLNAKRGYSWESNPWVWVIEFEKAEK
jgi:hypothetical protein